MTAVGDPHQSIYGWRGASATTLSEFRGASAARRPPARVLPLATSWRNDVAVLDVRERRGRPLREGSGLPVDAAARPRARRPRRGSWRRRVETAADGGGAASPIGWRSDEQRGGASTAVLCRKRSQFAPLVER